MITAEDLRNIPRPRRPRRQVKEHMPWAGLNGLNNGDYSPLNLLAEQDSGRKIFMSGLGAAAPGVAAAPTGLRRFLPSKADGNIDWGRVATYAGVAAGLTVAVWVFSKRMKRIIPPED